VVCQQIFDVSIVGVDRSAVTDDVSHLHLIFLAQIMVEVSVVFVQRINLFQKVTKIMLKRCNLLRHSVDFVSSIPLDNVKSSTYATIHLHQANCEEK
jgi:hypothetical protein